MIKIVVLKNEEIIDKITRAVKVKKIREGSITIIGAVDSCCISTMSATDARKDILHEYHEPLEIMGTGEIENGIVHLHIVLGQENTSSRAGHLHWGKVKTFFVNVYVTPLVD